jgi:hypothetical protein
MKSMKSNLAVYTVVMGDEFELPIVEGPIAGVDFICFSNRKLDPQGVWDIRLIEPLLPADLPRSSREYKIRPHVWLSDYSHSLYIDTKVRLLGNPIDLWNSLIQSSLNNVFGIFAHSYRETLRDEFTEVSQLNLDEGYVIEKQLKTYEALFKEKLSSKPLWGGIIARKHNESDCIKAMDDWYANVLTYSRRDQLSLPIALRHIATDRISVNQCSNFESSHHLWPVWSGKRTEEYFAHFEYSAVAERDSAVAERDSTLNSTIWRLFLPYRRAKSLFLRS